MILFRGSSNLLLKTTVADGTHSSTLVQNTCDSYDNQGSLQESSLYLHDHAYSNTFTYRGNVATTTRPDGSGAMFYDVGGSQISAKSNGVTTTSTMAPQYGYAAPSQITTGSLNNSLSWSSFLGLSSSTGPNGDSGSVTYDTNARPTRTTSPYGAATTYTYNDTASPPTHTATTGSAWVRATYDGFGRTVKTETGDGGGTKSIVDTIYAPCGCSPLGKVKQVSRPYAPGQTPVYTTYNYDGLGRTTSVVLPDGSTTSYAYWSGVVAAACALHSENSDRRSVEENCCPGKKRSVTTAETQARGGPHFCAAPALDGRPSVVTG